MLEYLRGKFANKYVQNFATIGIGTFIAQSIPVLVSPLLSRLFSPDEFGIFANYTAIMAFLVVINTGKYELGIILPKEHKDAINVVALSCFVLLVTTALILLLFLILGQFGSNIINYFSISPWIIFVPIGAFVANAYLILNEWYIRKGNYLGLSKNRITNTAGVSVVSLVFGAGKLSLGLIWGQICGQIVSVFFAFKRIYFEDKKFIKYISWNKIWYYSKRFADFAKFIIPGQLINSTTGLLSVSIITYYFGLYEVGLIALVDRVFGIPINIFGNSMNDVFKRQIVDTYHEGGDCLRVYKKVVLSLFIMAIVPFIGIFFMSPIVFPFIFGQSWQQAGGYAQILCFMFFLNFISMPTRWVFMVAEKQKLELIWQIIFMFVTIGSLLAGTYTGDIKTTILFWGAGRAMGYVVFIIMTYSVTKYKLNANFVNNTGGC